MLPRWTSRLFAVAVGTLLIASPSWAWACGCGRDFCPLHCPAEAQRDPQRALEYLEKELGNVPPEARASLAPLMEAKREMTVAAGDVLFNNRQQMDHIQERVRVEHPVGSAMDELKVIDALTRYAASTPPEKGRGITDSAWNDLVSGTVARSSVAVTGYTAEGRPIKEAVPAPDRSGAPPRPAQGFAVNDGRSLIKARQEVEVAVRKDPPVHVIEVPAPSATATAPASAAGRDMEAAKQFFRNQVEHFKQVLHGPPVIVTPSPADHAPSP